jgi:uncharacterized protein (DUF1810 family)
VSQDLDRFVEAQRDCYEQVLRELRAGHKTTHWIWYIFPQLRGLGQSERSIYYGIASRAEAAAYDNHPILGARLRECIDLVMDHSDQPLAAIFGDLDATKVISSMTLFELAAGDEPRYARVIETFNDGERDARTIELLGR